PPLPLFPRGRRALLPAAGAGLGGALRTRRRGRAPPFQPARPAFGDARPGQLPLAEEPLPAPPLPPDRPEPPLHFLSYPVPPPRSPRLGAAPRAQLAPRLRLALAAPRRAVAPAAGDPGAQALRDRH